MSDSLTPEYFEGVYASSSDPWKYETSEYEMAKYQDSLDSLPAPRYKNALEIGCSIGVLTQRLASRCDHLLGTDVSEKALTIARKRCHGMPDVAFSRMRIPAEYPESLFDLTVVSEVAYYWDRNDLSLAASLIRQHMAPGAHLLLVHWTPVVPDYPLTGDQVHEFFMRSPAFVHLHGHVKKNYRLDVFACGEQS